MSTLHAPTESASRGTDRIRGRLMGQSLAALLDRVRGAREALPLLAGLEQGLGSRGAAAIEQIALPVRRRICTQLASLPLPPEDAALQDLQDRLLRSLAQLHDDESSGPFERTVVIRELTHSEFMAVAATEPLPLDQPR